MESEMIKNYKNFSKAKRIGSVPAMPKLLIGGRKVKEKTDMTVVVSLGTEKTTMPLLKGLTREEAEKTAKDSKIILDIKEEISKTIQEGIVIRQENSEGKEIASGEEINAGETITIYVSSGTGIKKVVVTSVLYKDNETAKKTLENAGLTVEIEYGEDNSRNNGVVLKQSIESGETVEEGTKITLTVNQLVETKTGKVTIDIKSFTGFEAVTKVTKTEKNESGEIVEKVEEKKNTPKDVKLKIVANEKQIKNTTVKEDTMPTYEVSGKGNITIEVYINDDLVKTVDMNLNTTTEMTIKK